MFKLRTMLPRLPIRCFELKIPFSRCIGIVNQHHRGTMFQSEGLLFHHPLVLIEKDASEDTEQALGKGQPPQEVSGCAEIDPTLLMGDRRHGGPSRDPPPACLDELQAEVR